jgi:ABC-type uncharacterized transport system permease subunit
MILLLGALLYGASAVAYVGDLYGGDARLWGWALAAAGAGAETAGLVVAAARGTLAPQGAAFAIEALTWLVVANFLIADGFLGLRAGGAMLMPVAAFATLVALVLPAHPAAPVPGLLGPAHLFAALFGYGACTLAFAASGLYLIQERALRRRAFEGPYRRVPPLAWLDRAAHGLIAYGFPMLTLALGTELRHGPLPVAGTALVWALYGLYLWARATGRLRGRGAARVAVWGFAGALANVLFLSLVLNSV